MENRNYYIKKYIFYKIYLYGDNDWNKIWHILKQIWKFKFDSLQTVMKEAK